MHFKERIRKKVSCWKEQCLSKSGKEILIKSIATAIPSYAMSCFKFSSTFCKEINALLSNFWWGQKVMKENFIGLVGIISVNPTVVVGLVFEILNALIVLFLLSKGGGSSIGLMFIGLVGIIFVNPNVVVGFVFEVLNASIVLFLLSKGGGSSPGLILFSPGF